MTQSQNIMIRFGHRVRYLRNQLGLSQEDFAAKCELDRTYISSLERGKRNVSLKNIEAIAIALEVSLAELFTEIDFNDTQ